MKRNLLVKLALLLVLALSSVAYAQEDTENWQELATMPTARSEMPATFLDGKIYVAGGFGGFTTFEAYAVETDTWAELAPMPEGRHHLMSTAYDGKIYVFGGFLENWQPTATAFVYDPTTDEWTALAELPENRAAGAAIVLDESIYIVAGVSDDESVSPPLLRYDPAEDTWESLAPTAFLRDHVAAAVLDGKIWAIGGRDTGIEYASVEIYDPETETWEDGPSLNVARAGFNATVLDGKIYVAGGEVFAVCPDDSCPQTLDTVEVFDPETETWEIVTQLPVPLHGVPLVSAEDSIVVLGGSKEAGAILNDGRVFVYHPE